MRFGLEYDDLVYALDWYTEDPDSDGRVLHTLSVPRPVAQSIGLEVDDLTSFDALLDALDAAGRPAQDSDERDYPTSNDPVAVALGLPPGVSLQYCSQFLNDGDGRRLALEVTYTAYRRPDTVGA